MMMMMMIIIIIIIIMFVSSEYEQPGVNQFPKNFGARSVTWNKVHTEDPQFWSYPQSSLLCHFLFSARFFYMWIKNVIILKILGTTIQNLVVWDLHMTVNNHNRASQWTMEISSFILAWGCTNHCKWIWKILRMWVGQLLFMCITKLV